MFPKWLSAILAVVMPLALAGCAMTESTLIDADAKKPCDSDAGSYYLSKTMFEVLVTSSANEDAKLHPQRPASGAADPKKTAGAANPDALYAAGKLISVQAKAIADRSRGYCLDFLASPTAEEGIFVGRENGLLHKITTDSKDRSADILKNIIKTVLLASGADDGGPSYRADDEGELKPKQLFKGSYDPLNPEQANLINQTLRQHGFCLVIDEQEFSQHVHGIQDYCNNPLGHHSREKALDKAAEFDSHAASVTQVRGVLYRPRVAYNYYLYVKRGNTWRLRKSVAVNLENKAPVLALQIDRAFFTTRKTAITFDQGTLMNVRVDKGSELAGFVEVPLTLAQGIAALPANVVKVKIDVTNQRTTLISAQDQLLAAQLAYANDVRKLNGLPPLGVAGKLRSDQDGGNGDNGTVPPPPGAAPPPPFKQSEAIGTGGAAFTGRSNGSPARSVGAPRQVSFQTTVTPAASNLAAQFCQLPCQQQGSSGPACNRYCACYGQCLSTTPAGPAADRQRTCGNYCVGFLD